MVLSEIGVNQRKDSEERFVFVPSVHGVLLGTFSRFSSLFDCWSLLKYILLLPLNSLPS